MLTNMNFFSTDSHEILSECHMRLSEKSSKLENEITAKLGFLIFYEFYRPGGQEVPNYFPRNCRFEGPGGTEGFPAVPKGIFSAKCTAARARNAAVLRCAASCARGQRTAEP